MEVVIMEVLGRLVIKSFLLTIIIFSCDLEDYQWVLENNESVDLRKRYVEYNGEKYTGYLYKLAENQKDTILKSFYRDGLKHGVWKKFYNTGEIKEIRHFKKGKKTGKYLGYYMKGGLAFEYNFKDGEYHGKRYEWKKDGSLLRESTYENGYEKGVQKIWWPDGRVKSNYIIKNNRRYGLLGVKNCVNVSDSIFSN